ncbi:GerAB/ArcD/ProY family transporter [Clostridium grantii]|uniref:Spore germination protein (Amino acid permease) n=1 Tax=Clostridium grantii DSM 8605 TaxID=1121316 RepID=A0A1M5TKP8_9CLOT|nr:endospore germination permease [Clostridium grantii]SHH51347.1 spore germination protein (amino acid permease) [Clostridium grantii DSM 8605]
MDHKNNISKFDLFATVVVTVVGTGIFSLPSNLAEILGSEGWIMVWAIGVLVAFFVYIQCKVIKVNNFDRIDIILENNFGKFLGKIICLLIVIAGCFIISLELRTFTEVLRMYLLEKTPTELIMVLMILTGVVLIRGELEGVVMFNEIAFYLMFVPVIIVIPFVLNGADITNIFPVLTHKPMEYIKAINGEFFSFAGFFIIYMIHPFLKEKKQITKVALKSIIFITLFYSIIVMVSLAVFPEEYNKNLLWPTISMVSIVNIPGAFIEGWEGVAMIFWIFFYFTTFINVFYFNSEIIKNTFNLGTVKISSLIIMPIIYILAMYPDNITELFYIERSIMAYIYILVIGMMPLSLLFINFIKKGRKRDETN